MSCNSENPGATHHLGCACHEARWAQKLAAAEARAEKLEAALKEIAVEPCEEDGFGGPRTCGEQCHTCIARAALAKGGDRG